MSKLIPLSQKEFVKRMRDLGFDGPYAGGKHLYMLKDNLRLAIPNPHRQIISANLLMRILRQAGISREEWISKD